MFFCSLIKVLYCRDPEYLWYFEKLMTRRKKGIKVFITRMINSINYFIKPFAVPFLGKLYLEWIFQMVSGL